MRYLLLAVAALAMAPSCYGQCSNGRCQVSGVAGTRATSTSSWRTIEQVAPVQKAVAPAAPARQAVLVPMPMPMPAVPQQRVVVTSVTKTQKSVAVSSATRGSGCGCNGGTATGPLRRIVRVLIPHR